MSLRKVYLRHKEAYPDNLNTFTAYEGFWELAVEITPFYGFGDIETLTDLGPEVGLVGFIGDIWAALKVLDKPIPAALDYPEELTPWIGRKIWKGTLKEVRESTAKVFIKPVFHKLFTGYVWDGSRESRWRTLTCGSDTELWISEVVEFESEWRCFIQDREIVGVRHYKGDWSKAPNRLVVEAAVAAYNGPRGCSLDFGVTSTGETKLVEANDGFSLGTYGLPAVPYAKLIEARWEELTQ